MKPTVIRRPYGSFQVWDEPRLGASYVVGVDTAEGIVRDRGGMKRTSVIYRDSKPDYSAAIVIDLETGQHVASWQGDIPVTDWGYVVAAIGFYYNTALIVPEANNQGIEVVNTLVRRLRYPLVYRNRTLNTIEGDGLSDRWGWTTNKMTRPLLIARVEELLNHSRLFTRDVGLIKELRTMEYDDNGVARAKHPNHDDRVIALGLALQGRHERLNGTLVREDGEADRFADLPWLDRQEWLNVTRKREASERGMGSRSGGGVRVVDRRSLARGYPLI